MNTNLSATPSLWPSIETALAQSRYLILLASPEAGASQWVNKEVAYWLKHKGVGTLLIALTDGILSWDQKVDNFCWHAAGSGGPKGARNGNYKHGRYTAETIATRRWLREKIREVRALTKTLRDQP
jgi:hypothetical protein